MEFSDILGFIWEWVIVFFLFKLVIAKSLGNIVIAWFQRYTERTDRTDAIWEHWKLNRAGAGHQSEDVTSCGQENCAIFQAQ